MLVVTKHVITTYDEKTAIWKVMSFGIAIFLKFLYIFSINRIIRWRTVRQGGDGGQTSWQRFDSPTRKIFHVIPSQWCSNSRSPAWKTKENTQGLVARDLSSVSPVILRSRKADLVMVWFFLLLLANTFNVGLSRRVNH